MPGNQLKRLQVLEGPRTGVALARGDSMEMLTPIRSIAITAVACLSSESLEILRRADKRELIPIL